MGILLRALDGSWGEVPEQQARMITLHLWFNARNQQRHSLRAKAESGLNLLCVKASVFKEPGYTKNGRSATDGWKGKLDQWDLHATIAARLIEKAVEWADQAIELEGTDPKQIVSLPPLCDAARLAPLAHVVWPRWFTGDVAKWATERAAWLAEIDRQACARRAKKDAPPPTAEEDFSDLPLFFERAQSRLAAGEFSPSQAAKLREAFALIREAATAKLKKPNQKRVGAAVRGVLTA